MHLNISNIIEQTIAALLAVSIVGIVERIDFQKMLAMSVLWSALVCLCYLGQLGLCAYYLLASIAVYRQFPGQANWLPDACGGSPAAGITPAAASPVVKS